MKTFSGISVSRGISIAPVFQFSRAPLEFDTYTVANPQKEWERYEAAVSKTQKVLEAIYDKAVDEVGTDEASIFHAHIMILQDPELTEGVQQKILEDGLNAEAALFEVAEEYCKMLEDLDDEYIRARVLDIRDVRTSLLRTLLNVTDNGSHAVQTPSIIISYELTPSDCISIPKNMIQGFCTVEGGTTSHTAILARSLGVPALVGIPEEVLALEHGETVILDGYRGEIIAGAGEETIRQYERARDGKRQIQNKALEEAHRPAVTVDGHPVKVFANLGSDSQDDLKNAVKNGAEGVGLLRTEFIYLDCQEMPGEEYQYRQYRAVVEAFGERPVILRTLDIGGDKQLPYLELPFELNPFLGVRGLRLCLRRPDLFKTQLRAALRAAAHGNLQIMFPMVTKGYEVRQARQVLEECRQELLQEQEAVPEHIEVGIMIEIPAAALLADRLAQEVDFFSIGTNDLSQYTLAVDRTNTTLADLANAFDPSVLYLIQKVSQAAHRYGKSVGVCGEMAGDPLAIPILVGLGIDELSMNLPVVPVAKQIIRQLNYADMVKLADEVLQFDTPAQVKQHVNSRLPFLEELI